MAVIATEGARFSALVKHEYEPSLSYCREAIDTDIAFGTVLGKVTATGAYVAHAPAAVDGSEKAAGVSLGGMLALVRGPVIVADSALIYNAATDTDAEKAAVKDALKALGIIVEVAK